MSANSSSGWWIFTRYLRAPSVSDGNRLACSVFILGCVPWKAETKFFRFMRKISSLVNFFNPQLLVCWTVSKQQRACSTAVLILPRHISVKNYIRVLACSCPCCMLGLKPSHSEVLLTAVSQGVFLAIVCNQEILGSHRSLCYSLSQQFKWGLFWRNILESWTSWLYRIDSTLTDIGHYMINQIKEKSSPKSL